MLWSVCKHTRTEQSCWYCHQGWFPIQANWGCGRSNNDWCKPSLSYATFKLVPRDTTMLHEWSVKSADAQDVFLTVSILQRFGTYEPWVRASCHMSLPMVQERTSYDGQVYYANVHIKVDDMLAIIHGAKRSPKDRLLLLFQKKEVLQSGKIHTSRSWMMISLPTAVDARMMPSAKMLLKQPRL
jgi:hypothetical protein